VDQRAKGLRRRLGGLLRVIRSREGLSGPQLAVLMSVNQSTISRVENAERRPSLADVEAWLDACHADEAERAQVMALAEAIEHGVTTIRDLHRGSLEIRQREMIEVDAHARQLRHFHPTIITGPFHSAAYARACIKAANFGRLVDVEAAVETRLQRGERLRGLGATPYHVVLGEAALRWVSSAGPGATAETLRNLLDATTTAKTMTIQVIPLSTPMTALPQVGFYMVDWKQADEPPMVIVETPAAELTFVGTDECADFEQSWQRMVSAALGSAASRDFIAACLAELGSSAPDRTG
jgi:transcriptional regulator with XRE-family HTH domain